MYQELFKLLIGKLNYGYICISQLKNGRMIEKYYSIQSLPTDELDWLEHINNKAFDVFFCTSILKAPKRNQENAMFTSGVFVDIDNCSIPEARKKLAQLPDLLSTPSLLVNSGNGCHCYWFFKQKLQVQNNNNNFERIKNKKKTLWNYSNKWRRCMKELHIRLQSDPRVIDTARIMRLPGTYNSKGNKLCYIEEINPDKVFDLNQIIEALDIQTTPNQKTIFFNNEPRKKSKYNKQNTYNKSLINEIIDLASKRSKNNLDIGYRNTTLFYLHLLRVSDSEIVHINQKVFSKSLPDFEVNNIISYKVKDNIKSYYPKLKTIVEQLNITKLEQTRYKYLTNQTDYEFNKMNTELQKILHSVEKKLARSIYKKYSKTSYSKVQDIAEYLKISKSTVLSYKKKRNSKNELDSLYNTIQEMNHKIKIINKFHNENKGSTSHNYNNYYKNHLAQKKRVQRLEFYYKESLKFMKNRLSKQDYKQLQELIERMRSNNENSS